MSIILGLRSKHDAAAALVIDGKIVAAAAEERFSKIKHHFGFPAQSIQYVLAEARIRPDKVDIVARDRISIWKTVQRLARQTTIAYTPRLYKDIFAKATNRYLLHKVDINANEEQQLLTAGFRPNWFFVEHHQGHAAYAIYASGLKDASVMILDGRGHYLGGAIYVIRQGNVQLLSEIIAEGGSLGLFYSAVTDALGFQVGDGDGKTMGLACYGDPSKAYTELEKYAPQVRGLTTFRNKEWQLDSSVSGNRLLGHYAESAELRQLIQKYGDANVAAAAQLLLENRVEELARNVVNATGNRTLVGGGGVFLNVKTSKQLIDHNIVDSIYIPPGPGDDGLPAGYALAACAALDRNCQPLPMQSAYLGPEFSDEEIVVELAGYSDLAVEKLDNVAEVTARLVSEQNVIGWFQGRMEWGPRALGNRSVLADPRNPTIRDHINERLKKRDWFMPFAPSVLKEYCPACFDNYQTSPYMNLAFKVRPPYDQQAPAIMHVDQTARPQEVDQSINPLFYAVIEAFRQLTGIPMLLNTSFNRHGLPIVCTPQDAINHLRWGCVDLLIIGSFLVRRTGAEIPFPGVKAITGSLPN